MFLISHSSALEPNEAILKKPLITISGAFERKQGAQKYDICTYRYKADILPTGKTNFFKQLTAIGIPLKWSEIPTIPT